LLPSPAAAQMSPNVEKAKSQPAPKYGLGVLIHGVKPKFALGEEVNLRAKLNWKGPKAELSYRWSSVGGGSLPHNADTRSSVLTIPKGELTAGAQYHLRLEVTAQYEVASDDEDEPPTTVTTTAKSDVQFVVNEPPSGGTCEMDVQWRGGRRLDGVPKGEVAGAAVTLSAPGWNDSDRIQYRYFLIRNGKAMRVKNWSQQTRTAISTLARVGDTLQARCEIRDELGDGLTETSKEVKRSP
jgi:hypothetical protein